MRTQKSPFKLGIEMRYVYESFHANKVRFDVSTRVASVPAEFENYDYVLIYDMIDRSKPCVRISTKHELEEWAECRERDIWKNADKKMMEAKQVKNAWDALAETDGFHVAKGEPPEKPPATEKDHINPSHYQALMKIESNGIFIELQWLEHLQYHAHFRDPAVFKSAVEMQARKYLDRCGGKDNEVQEIMKAVWYLRFLAAYIKNGGPIFVKDIPNILG